MAAQAPAGPPFFTIVMECTPFSGEVFYDTRDRGGQWPGARAAGIGGGVSAHAAARLGAAHRGAPRGDRLRARASSGPHRLRRDGLREVHAASAALLERGTRD